VALLDAFGLASVDVAAGVPRIDSGELPRRWIERLWRSRRVSMQRTALGPVAPLGHCSILFAAPDGGLFMANIASQKKRNARTERERLENLRFRSSVKTYFRRLEAAVQAGDANAISAEHTALVSRIDKAVQKGALHRNTGARKKARAASIAGTASQSQAQDES
jgi:small subunit ribosomal protein S20